MPHVDDTGAVIAQNEIGPNSVQLTNEEHQAVIAGLQQVARGEDPTPAVATVCILAIARLAGIDMTGDMHRQIRPTFIGDAS